MKEFFSVTQVMQCLEQMEFRINQIQLSLQIIELVKQKEDFDIISLILTFDLEFWLSNSFITMVIQLSLYISQQ